MNESGRTVTIRPSKSHPRQWVIPVSRRKYFESGGFSVSDDTVRVQARFGRVSTVSRSKVDAVVITRGPRGDTRALLTKADGSVLTQDQGVFYSDDALDRLAAAIGCRLVNDPYRNFASLDNTYPGALRYRWERHPALTGFLAGLIICAPVVLMTILTH